MIFLVLPAAILTAILTAGSDVVRSQVAITGPATIIDGDTIDVRGTRIRIFGIDAPESDQTCLDGEAHFYPCGTRATEAMRDLVAGRDVACLPQDQDRYGRIVAICSIDGADLGEAMVRLGWAIDYMPYSHRQYVGPENEARQAKRGMWAGHFETPKEWRLRGSVR